MMMMVGEKVEMERAEEELERRSRNLSSLIQQQRIRNRSSRNKATAGKGKQGNAPPEAAAAAAVLKGKREGEAIKDELVRELPERQRSRKEEGRHGGRGVDLDLQEAWSNVRIRASDMPQQLQRRAFRCAREALAEMPRLDSKRLARMLKKEFDSSYGPAWHCIVGTSFGSYVTHSFGGFLYFSIDKVYILLFRTAVEPLEQ